MKRDHEQAAGTSSGGLLAPTIEVPQPIFLKLVERALIEPFATLAPRLAEITPWKAANRILPKIGQERHGGIYAGVTLQDEQPHELILLAGAIEGTSWDKATAWAKEQGGELPSRFDQLVLFKNLKSEFEEASYWSGEQHAGGSVYAWSQNFGYGDQYGWHKDFSCRARAVRRLPIE